MINLVYWFLWHIGEAVILRHVRNGVELAPIDQNLYYDFDYQLTNHVTPRVVLPVSDIATPYIHCSTVCPFIFP